MQTRFFCSCDFDLDPMSDPDIRIWPESVPKSYENMLFVFFVRLLTPRVIDASVYSYWPWPWPWFSWRRRPRIGPHPDASLVCRASLPLFFSQVNPNLCKSFLTDCTGLCSLSLADLVLPWNPEPPRIVLAVRCDGGPFVSHDQAAQSSFSEFVLCSLLSLVSTVGRTPVFGRRTDPVLSSACSRRVTTMWVNRPL